MPNKVQQLPDIMHYESEIWAIADDLLAAAIKQSDFPTYMMPFFAIMMLEGRMRNAMQDIMKTEGITPESDPDDFKEAFLEKGCGYNELIVMKGKTLKKICANDVTFEQDFHNYLHAFDDKLKQLLGIERGKDDEKFLGTDTIVANLRGKKNLQTIVSKWANIDLSGYTNSDITTLEEHIKRKWADISASTAGEQYTPQDIISLISEIVGVKIKLPKQGYLRIYDPTCGGANLLFGVADKLAKDTGYPFIATYGSEYNDALYALAAIESRFREESTIHYGNTLTSVPFQGQAFDVIVANPPYGTKWSSYESAIKNDQTGQFAGGIPAVSDGQLLFMQHILWQLAETGIAVEVHNGSSLFSGDAGGGESNIRKYVFDNDWVEAIIQMPQQEFFNTGIYTYLWIMNKNKPADRKDKVALIDASHGWKLLKKSKGDKRREMLPEHRQAIVDALVQFQDSDICKIYNREYFYYNKQKLILTEVDENGEHVTQSVCPDGKAFPIKNTQRLLVDGVWYDWDDLTASEVRALGKQIADSKLEMLVGVQTADGSTYICHPDTYSIVHTTPQGLKQSLGCGAFAFKLKVSNNKVISRSVTIIPYTYLDYEIIPHRFDAETNQAEIDAFMVRYITKPFELRDNIVGVELNFNKEFYVPEKIESVDSILAQIEGIEQQLQKMKL